VEHLCLRQGPIHDPGALSAALSNNTRLRRLELQGMSLGEEGGVVLTSGLQSNTFLTYLNISSNGLGIYRHILKNLSEALFKHPALTFLDLSRNDIEESAVVGEHVGMSLTLTTLKLQQNKLRGDGVKGLVDGLSMNLALKELDVGRNDMPTIEALQLLQAVKLSNVQDLNLQDNLVGEQGAEGMAKMLMVESRVSSRLPKNRTKTLDEELEDERPPGPKDATVRSSLPQPLLQILNLRHAGLGSAGGAKVFRAVPASPLRQLNLAWNHLGPAVGEALAQCLADPGCRLEVLDLRDNHLGSSDVVAAKLRDVLGAGSKQERLQEFHLSNNDFNSNSAKQLCNCFEYFQSLRTVSLHCQVLGVNAYSALRRALYGSIRVLNIGQTGMGDQGVIALADFFFETKVEDVDISGNNIGDAGIRQLLQRPAPQTLKLIDFSFNNIHDGSAQSLMEKFLPAGCYARFEANNLTETCMERLARVLPPTPSIGLPVFGQ
jgi:Ran GTPase-activating protein (RanGAP) involved in mRNA processing and transport